MVDNRKIDTDYEYQKIVAERTVWLVKPLAVVCMVLWCLHPATSSPDSLERNMMLGFLIGAFYGIFVNRKVLQHYLFTRRNETVEKKNRMPEEYYFGRVKEVLDEEK